MTTSSKILTGFFFVLIFSCHQGKNNTRQILSDSTVEDKSIIIDSSHGILADPISGKKNACSIDTLAILKNQNLPPLIDELEYTGLVTYKTTKAIPSYILNFLKCSQGGEFTIANPGEHWQATDVIFEELPDRQLIFFGINDSIALMAHYTGGIGKSEHILIFKIKDKDITDFWCGNVLANLRNKQEVIKFLKKNKDKKWGLNTNIIYF